VDVIYLDFRKAFDTVPHRRLIRKLETYGMKDGFLTWIGKLSTWAEILSSIPHTTWAIILVIFY